MAGSPLRTRIGNRLARARQHRWRAAAYRSDRPHIVMGGAPRSGTTVLRKLLDRHPHVRAGAETKLFVPAAFNLEFLAQSYAIALEELEAMRAGSRSQGAFIDAFAARVLADAGKRRWAEKTPQNIRHLDWITARFPQASLVHIIRDGRDVVCSMRRHPDWRWVDGGWQKVLVERPLAWYAQRWLGDTAAGMARRGQPGYHEVRYEDLVTEPLTVLRALCEGTGLEPELAWLATAGRRVEGDGDEQGGPEADAAGQVATAPGRSSGDGETGQTKRPDYGGAVSDASVGRWREDLSAAEQREVERLCGPRLRELGYEA